MSLHSTFLATWLLGSGLSIIPRAMSGQVPASDSTAASDTSQQRAGADSGSTMDSTRASATATAPTAPADSILRAACGGPAGQTTVARDLLVVVFAPEARRADRAAAARSVDGTLLGPVVSGDPGAYYVGVPSGGEEWRLRLAADRLIQVEVVRQVGSRACPQIPR